MLRLASLEFTLENVAQFIIAGSIFAVMAWFTQKSLKSAPIDDDGWRWIRPSFIHHFALVGSLVFAVFMWWLYLFVGSARADAATQEQAMLLLASAFSVGCIIVWWIYYANRLCWRDDQIRIWTLGRFDEYSFEDIVEIKDVNGQGKWKFTFLGGKSVYVEEVSHGFEDLGEQLDKFIR